MKTGRLLAVLVAFAALAGCSAPPGPAPASPAPTIPEDAIAYDDLLSGNRQFPFSNSCDQVDTGALQAVGAQRAFEFQSASGASGCSVEFGTAELESMWIEMQPPPNPSEPRYFPLVWNGSVSGAGTYHRRLVLDGRYYATETIDFYGGLPGCYLTVDTGSPEALQFRGIVPEQHAAPYGELNSSLTDYEVDYAGTQRFMTENCPLVEKTTIALLDSIDPDGGSLGT